MKNKCIYLAARVVGLAFLLVSLISVGPPSVQAQKVKSKVPDPRIMWASNVIVPQSRVLSTSSRLSGLFRSDSEQALSLVKVDVVVDVLEQHATTTLDMTIKNKTNHREEAEILLPVPKGATIRSFSYEDPGAKPNSDVQTARLLPREEAKRTYEAIVAKTKDPALLEFVNYELARSSVFPIAPNGTMVVRLVYEHLLRADGDRIDYELPRTEAVEYNTPWNIRVRIKSTQLILTAYSPSHGIETERTNRKALSVKILPSASREPGPFRLSYLLERNGVNASLFASPDKKIGGGYFLLLAGVPVRNNEAGEKGIGREVTLVLDRSGSMNGEKIEQVRQAAYQILGGLEEGETFNVIIYNSTVESFSETPVPATSKNLQAARDYLAGVRSNGGTNIHDALQAALKPKPSEGLLPIVLFLTDGLPTVGNTSEKAIREVAEKSNPHKRRIFTFGVGVDVNAPLLEKIALDTRATSTFVLPKEDVEVKVGEVFKDLQGPVLADVSIHPFDTKGEPAVGRVRDLLPNRLPDLFENDQMVLLGQYVGSEPLVFHLSGNYRGTQRTFQFKFDLTKANQRNAFVPRLWASRQIATLTDQIRAMGAEAPQQLQMRQQASSVMPMNSMGGGISSRYSNNVAVQGEVNPALNELVEEVVRLSTEFGILTEYTAFLAKETTDLSQIGSNNGIAIDNYSRRAMQVRTGLGAFNQAANGKFQRSQTFMNTRNSFFDAGMNSVSISNVQQVGNKAFFNRDGRWVDSQIASTQQDGEKEKPTRKIRIGSEEHINLARRLAEEGNEGAVAMQGEIMIEVGGESILLY